MDAIIEWTLWVAIATLFVAIVSVIVTLVLARTTKPHAHLRAEWDSFSTHEYGKAYIGLRLYNDGNAPARAIEIRLNTYEPPADAPPYVRERPYVRHGYIAPNGEPWECQIILGPWLWEEGRSPQLMVSETDIGGVPPTVTATVSYQPFDSRIPKHKKSAKEKRIELETTSPSVMW